MSSGCDSFISSSPIRWEDTFICLPWTFSDNPEHEYSSKISLPSRVLGNIVNMEIPSPMTFLITANGEYSYSAASEFHDGRDFVYLPYWMMHKLRLSENDPVHLEISHLPVGKSIRVISQSSEYAQVEDIKGLLEEKLKDYAALSVGDEIVIRVGELELSFAILEVRSAEGKCKAIITLNTDLRVEFERPLDCPPTPLANQPSENVFACAEEANIFASQNVETVSQSGFQYFIPLDDFLIRDGDDHTQSLSKRYGEKGDQNSSVSLPSGFRSFSGKGRTLK